MSLCTCAGWKMSHSGLSATMPLNAKGQKIMRAMKKTYGPKKGERVFHASRNAGRISNVEKHNTVRSIRKQHAGKLGRY